MLDSESPLGKPWLEITREERYFCAELFFEIRKDVKKFIRFLNAHTKLNLDKNHEWEIGYEVCFYRDLLYTNRKRVRKYEKYPAKRTFDLCLFSKSQIIIIEAKAQEDFISRQMDNLFKDGDLINDLLRFLNYENIDVILCLLYSTQNPTNLSLPKFTWKNLYDEYGNPIFKTANELPDRPKPLD